ncbi:MAG TPA: hypothetical protein VF719_09840, partial [Abditibacteriaceae bacterium]
MKLSVPSPRGSDNGSGLARVALIPQLTATAVMAISSLVLLGWACGIDSLRRVLPGLMAMNPATAIALLMVALSLWLLQASPTAKSRLARQTQQQVGRVCAGIAVAIGMLKLLELFLGWEIGVDRWLFSSKLADGGTAGIDNRMAPPSAVASCLTGASLLLLDARSRPSVCLSQSFILASALTSLFAVIGYVYEIDALHSEGGFVPMALHTAFCFILIAVGILSARLHRGIMKIFASRGLGGIVARRLLPAAILVPVLLGWLRLEGQRAGLYDTVFGIVLLVTMT